MTYLVSPELPVAIGGKEYLLSPSIECLKKIQQALKMDILDIMAGQSGGKITVHFNDYAKIIQIAIEDAGDKVPLPVIEQWIVDEVGINTIRQFIQAWLLVITSPKKEREAMQTTVGKSLKALGLTASLGKSTSNSASDTSAGLPENSGDPTSGK